MNSIEERTELKKKGPTHDTHRGGPCGPVEIEDRELAP
jgi:hypothetical protein